MELSELSSLLRNNSLVLENIFQYLNLNEHLKLIHICPEFREAIVQIIWRAQCKELLITERSETYLVSLNQKHREYCVFKREFLEFFELNQFNIYKLQLNNCESPELLKTLVTFENISTLEMQYCQVSNLIVKKIAENCRGLKKLTLDRCVQRNGPTDLVLGQDIPIDTLAEMPCLEELNFLNRYKVKIDYEVILAILGKLRLSKFCLSASIIYADSIKNLEGLTLENGQLGKHLRHLDIGRFSNRTAWSKFVKNHLPHFEHLQTLAIFIDLATCVLINDDFLNMISDSCRQLRNISFKQCKFKVENVRLPHQLKTLSLVWCWGLRWKNFQQILQECQLETFFSINGHYDGNDVNYFYHSESLTTMIVETSLIKDITNIFSSSKALFPHITTLRWLNTSGSCYNQPQEIRHNIAAIFPTLQELVLEQAYLSIRDFQKISYLQVFRFSLFDNMSWPYLLNLLQSTALTQLVIDIPANYSWPLCPILVSQPHGHLSFISKELTKNLKFLEIPFQMFRNSSDFWLDFLQKSHNLKLKFYDSNSHGIFKKTFLHSVLNSEKFPKNLKSINICNNIVDCNDLRKSFAKIMDKHIFISNPRGEYFIVL